MRKYDAVCAGHICLDLIPDFNKENQNIDNVFVPGKLAMVGGMNMSSGGAVSNTGIALNKLGVNTCLMGKTGDDELGSLLRKILKDRYGFSDTLAMQNGQNTSYSIVISLPHTDRIFLHNTGANDTFDASDIDMQIVSTARLFHFGYPPAMKKMYENGAVELIKMFKAVKESGAATSLDMCPPDADSKTDWKDVLKRAAEYIDIFLPSIEEIALMIDKERFLKIKKQAGKNGIVEYIDMDYVAQIGGKLIDMGYKIVVLKCGSRGLYVKTSSADALHTIGGDLISEPKRWAEKEYFSCVYKVEDVKSATGAGDTSIAGFLAAVLRGEDVLAALNIAAVVGAECVQTYGASEKILPYDETKLLSSTMDKSLMSYSGDYWVLDEENDVFKSSK